jgi:hypothetical protein
MSIVRDLFTGVDGVSHDIGRYMAAAATVTGLSLEVWAVLMQKTFDFQAYGIGCGALAAGVGAMMKLKETTEPTRESFSATSTTTSTVTEKQK